MSGQNILWKMILVFFIGYFLIRFLLKLTTWKGPPSRAWEMETLSSLGILGTENLLSAGFSLCGVADVQTSKRDDFYLRESCD